MLNFSKNLPSLRLDRSLANKTFRRVAAQVWRESAREWLRSIIENVPVETGMARATLIPLGEYLNNVGGLSFSATRRPYYSKLEGGVQSIDLGIDYTEFEIDDDALDGTLKLIWNPHTIHYWVAGYYKGNATPGPELLDNAESVFEEAFQTRMDKRLPAALDELIK